MGEFKKSLIKVNEDALLQYEHLKQNDLFSTIKGNIVSGDTITVFVHNMRLLLKNMVIIATDDILMNNSIIGFTRTKLNSSDSTCRIIGTLNFFYINSNNNKITL